MHQYAMISSFTSFFCFQYLILFQRNVSSIIDKFKAR